MEDEPRGGIHWFQERVQECMIIVLQNELRVRVAGKYEQYEFQIEDLERLIADVRIRVVSDLNLFQEAIELSENQGVKDSYSQIKIRVGINLALVTHTDRIESIEGYEFGFLVMLYRHAMCFYENNVDTKPKMMMKAAELRRIIETCSKMGLIEVYKYFFGITFKIPDLVLEVIYQDGFVPGIERALPRED